jgi:hypothetical protein
MLREGLGDSFAILVVEGETDKNLFRRLCCDPQQILVTDGKKLLLEAHAKLNRGDRGKIVFVADCDGETALGTLRGAPDLVITSSNDLETDLVGNDMLAAILPELLTSKGNLVAVAKEVTARAVRVAIPIGRIRRAARFHGISLKSLNSWDIKFMDLLDEKGSVDFDRAIGEVTKRASLTSRQERLIRETVGEVASNYDVCNGHDLIAAIEAVLHRHYGVTRRKLGSLDSMLRMAAHPATCSEWDVLRRLRRWQEAHGRTLLEAA